MEKIRRNRVPVFGISALLCVAAVVLSFCAGAVWYSPLDILRLMAGRGGSMNRAIFLYSRLPRTMAAFLSGAALAVSGAVLQNVLANKLASPSIIGVNAGAGLGVTLCCAAGLLSGWAVSCAAFCGSLVTVLLIWLFSYRTGASRSTVILGGVALNSVLNAFSESVTVLDSDVAALSIDFRVGGFSAVSYFRLLPAAVLIVAGLAVLLTLCNELDVVTLGDDTARGVGMDVRKYRILFLILAALLAGAAVSFAGLLGFIGLIVPHFVRRLTGNESRRLLPLCAVIGGGFVTLCDTAARVLFLPYELPVGILMAAIGGPVFVAILIRGRGGQHDD